MNWQVMGASEYSEAGSGAVQRLVAQRADGRRGGGAVALEQIHRRLFRHGVVLLGVPGIHLVDDIPRHARDRIPAGENLRQLDLDRVHARDVVHGDADLASVLGHAGLPLFVREAAGERRQRARPLLEAIGQGVRPWVGGTLWCHYGIIRGCSRHVSGPFDIAGAIAAPACPC